MLERRCCWTDATATAAAAAPVQAAPRRPLPPSPHASTSRPACAAGWRAPRAGSPTSCARCSSGPRRQVGGRGEAGEAAESHCLEMCDLKPGLRAKSSSPERKVAWSAPKPAPGTKAYAPSPRPAPAGLEAGAVASLAPRDLFLAACLLGDLFPSEWPPPGRRAQQTPPSHRGFRKLLAKVGQGRAGAPGGLLAWRLRGSRLGACWSASHTDLVIVVPGGSGHWRVVGLVFGMAALCCSAARQPSLRSRTLLVYVRACVCLCRASRPAACPSGGSLRRPSPPKAACCAPPLCACAPRRPVSSGLAGCCRATSRGDGTAKCSPSLAKSGQLRPHSTPCHGRPPRRAGCVPA